MDVQFRKMLLLLGDALFMFASLLLVVRLRFMDTWEPMIFWIHARAFWPLYPLWFVLLYTFDQYEIVRARFARSRALFFAALAVCFFVGLAYFYLVPHQRITPKTNLLLHVAVFGALACAWRMFYFRHIAGSSPTTVGLMEDDILTPRLSQLVGEHRPVGYTAVLLNRQGDLSAQISQKRVAVFVIPSSFQADPSGATRLYDCFGAGAVFLEPVQLFELLERTIPLETVDERWCVRNIRERRAHWEGIAKRTVDVVVASLALAVASPFCLLIAVAIKLDDGGPLFYRQQRVGLHGRQFEIVKFRSMREDAERSGSQWAVPKDPRATRVGTWLRRTHVDELPQLVNILRGDISFVGPRPERPEFVERLEREIPHYRLRHLIRPGFTGWAQVRMRYARSVSDSRAKFEYDLYYLKHRSLVLDGLIILKTARLLFRGE